MTILRDFEYEDHTADIKVVGYGNTMKRAIEALMLGILNIMYDVEKVDPKETISFTIKANDILDIVFKIGSEVLNKFYVGKYAIRDIRVKNLRKEKENKEVIWIANVVLHGEKYDVNKHGFKKEVKAVTYHDLDIKRIRKSLWISSMVVDI